MRPLASSTPPPKARDGSIRYIQVMVWFFERAGRRLRYEIGRHADGYRLMVAYPGEEPILAERFDEPYALQERTLYVERVLARNGWHTSRFPSERPTPLQQDELDTILEAAAAGIL